MTKLRADPTRPVGRKGSERSREVLQVPRAGGTFRLLLTGSALALLCGLLPVSATPVAASSGTDTVISAGSNFTCAIKPADSTLACWGNNSFGQVSKAPTGTFTSVSAGALHACALRTGGGAPVCWGYNIHGEAPSSVPYGNLISISAGFFHTCGIKAIDSSIICWGSDSKGQVTHAPTTGIFVAVYSGSLFSCALSATSLVSCWGNTIPTLGVPPADTTVLSLSAGTSNVCAVKSDLSLFCWGDVTDSIVTSTPYPLMTPAWPSGSFRAVSVGSNHACAIRYPTDNVVCWGDNTYWQATPPPLSFTARAISAGDQHTCAITIALDFACWGSNGGESYQGQAVPPTGSYTLSGPSQFGVGGTSKEYYIAPAGICSVTVDSYGAQGGGTAGGAGGYTHTILPVDQSTLAGTAFLATVGRMGHDGNSSLGQGGVPDGGAGGAGFHPGFAGSGGGGSTDLRVAPFDSNSRVVVAGGGGGTGDPGHAGGQGGGLNGGAGGQAVGGAVGQGGGGGTPTKGGAGGAGGASSGNAGIDGSFGAGGPGNIGVSNSILSGAGGGGGGWYGGGGGGTAGNQFDAGAGGGGSGYAIPTASGTQLFPGNHLGDGYLTITTGDPCKGNPTITTLASTNVAIGATISDTAHLLGVHATLLGDSDGTLSFVLFGPNDLTCSQGVLGYNTVPASHDGYYNSAAYSPGPARYRWLVSYSGNRSNNPVSSTCGDTAETSLVTGTPDQYQTTVYGNAVVGENQAIAQTFTAGRAGQLDAIQVALSRQGDPGPLSVQIFDTSPTGALLGSGTLPQAALIDTGGGGVTWVTVPLDVRAPSVPGHQYTIVLSVAPCTAVFRTTFCSSYRWIEAGTLYAYGTAWSSFDNGANWIPRPLDGLTFVTFVATATVDSGSVTPGTGGAFTTSLPLSASNPVTTSISSPVSGPVSVVQTATYLPAPTSFQFLNQQVIITAPPATIANPLQITFTLDATLYPTITTTGVYVWRNENGSGGYFGTCDSSGHASPSDPCIVRQTVPTPTSLQVVILTSHASIWNFALPIVKTTPTITWSNPANITYGTALSATQLDAIASVPGLFTYSPAIGAILHAGADLPLSVSFTPADLTRSNPASASAVINVLRANQAITFVSPLAQIFPSSRLTLLASSSSGLSVALAASGPCSLSASTLTISGPGTCSITATQAGSADYIVATSVTRSFSITLPHSTTRLAPSSPSVLFGQSLTLKATVSLGAPTFSVPTGAVTFNDGPLVLGNAALDATGLATLSTSALLGGVHTLTANFAGDAHYLGSTSAASVTITFTSCVTAHNGPLTIAKGEAVCITGYQNGPITVQAGAALAINGGSISGPVSSNRAAAVVICGAHIIGPLSISGSTGQVLIGDAGDDNQGCAANTIAGPVSLTNNTGGFELGGNTVQGPVSLIHNSGRGPIPEGGTLPPPEIEANRVSGPLSCSNNAPSATNDGHPNTVSGPRSGQCAAAGF